MKNKILLLLLVIIPLFSFNKSKEKTENLDLVIGIYSGCTKCVNTVELSINEDSTFHYLNKSNPSKIIDVEGKWTIAKNNNSIILKSNKDAKRFPDKWKIDKNYLCLKSEMTGLEIIRLCKNG